MWVRPIPFNLIETSDSESYARMPSGKTGLPVKSHVGAFGVKRKHHVHEGVDLYVPQSTPVMAVEAGEVVAVSPFTGAHAGSPWWKNTWAVYVEGQSGVVVYGEVAPHVLVGSKVSARELLGVVIRVLAKDKGRPMSMLHLELHSHGANWAPVWEPNSVKPEVLLDPTEYLLPLSEKEEL